MSSILFYNTTIFTGRYNEKIENACLLVENGKIKQIITSENNFDCDLENPKNIIDKTPKSKMELFKYTIDKIDVDETIDLEGKYILPGFIDIHMHGFAGIDIMTSGDKIHENLDKLAQKLALTGTTAFLPTTLTDDLDKIKSVIVDVKNYMLSQNENCSLRAKVAGINLEGPYISAKKKGAQNEEFIRDIEIEEINEIIRIGQNVVKIITLAPEKPSAMSATSLLAQNSITVSLGHSNCEYETANDAALNGASLITHLFNGMSAFGHRQPGLVGAGMMNDALSVELICDGLHIKDDVIAFMFKSKPIDKIVCITDSLSAAGLENGEYMLGGLEITKDDNIIFLKNEKTLAGSCLTMDKALRNVVSFTCSKVEQILPAFTINPARIARIDDNKGTIEPGKDADIVIMDINLNVVKTYISGF